MEEFCGSKFWDLNLTWNTDTPDFTDCFERTVFTAIPCLFLGIFCIFDFLSSYTSKEGEVPWSPLTAAKATLNTGLIFLEIGMFVVFCIMLPAFEYHAIYLVHIYVPAVRVSALILSMGLMFYSKSKGVRSSGIQFIFWLLLALTQAIRFRTVILQSYHNVDGSNPAQSTGTLHPALFIMEVIYFPIVAGQLFLHCWADMAPVFLNNAYFDTNACPEATSSFLSKALFGWYTPLAWKGFKKPLEYSDLWNLNSNLQSRTIVPAFDEKWPRDLNGFRNISGVGGQKKKANSKNNVKSAAKVDGGIFSTSVKAFGITYMFGFCFRILPDLMVFVSPQILNLLIKFAGSDEPTWKGILYAVILLLNAILSTILNANGVHLFYKTGIRIRTALVSAIYRKSLLLSNSAKKDRSTGEIVNHMAVDVQYVAEFTQTVNLVVTSPLIIAIALYFLWNILGVAALAGVVIMVLLLPLNAFVASRVQRLQKEQMAYKDKRTKLMTEILSGIKCLKLYAWEPSFEKQVIKIRQMELKVLKQAAYWNAVANFFWSCAPFMVAIGSFGTFVLIDSSNVLDAQTAFVSLSLFNIMNQPLTFLPLLISNYIQAAVGLKRLNKYLNADEIEMTAVSHDSSEANPIVIESASFSWDENSETGATLQDINLQVKDGELVAIVGVVGSGKSSLLSALLNELVKLSGRVNIRGNIAYVAQQAWIQNATVRDNILFGRPYDHIKYKKVVDACALKPDLDMLPAGDKTEIGEKGINLSGGQKQRISLARAVYSNADVFLLDDPLSAVDAHVGKHIFEKVIGPKGLLRRKTRLLVTHGIVYLPSMDNIVVMSDGRINETGTYQALQDINGAFADFLKQHTTTTSSEDVSSSDNKSQQQKQRNRERRKSGIASDSETEFSGGSTLLKRVHSSASFASSMELENNKLIEEETAETESVKASVYLDYFHGAGWGIVSITLVMYLIFQGFSVSANLWLSQWTNLAPTNGTSLAPEENQNSFYLSIYGALGFFQAISILFASIIMALGTVKAANVLHLKMLERILRAPLQFFDVTPTGRIVNRFSRDVDSVDNILSILLRFLLNSIFSVISVLVVISVSTPLFTLVIIPVGLVYYCVQRFYVCTSRQLKRLESITRSPIYSHFGETVSGASTIRAYGQQERFILESEKRQDHNMISYFLSVTANRWLQIKLETVGNTVVFFAALFAVLGKDTLSAGLVGLSVSYALQITYALLMLVRFTSDVETNIVAVERMKEYSQCPQEAPWSVPMWRPPNNWPQSGAIAFDQFKARYRPGLDLVLKNVTCSINPGEKVGIVGRTGAGKSSVTLGIFRIVEAAGGKILVDGEDISRFGLHDVRARITIIPQEPMLFSGSLKLNLDPFEEKRDEELWRSLELAHLKNYVRGLPGGLNYEIVEGGENLSVGQRQLVCLARALLRRTKILVLDEATSAVDLDTEELILKTIRSEFKDSTVVTIAHRINTIMDSDRVIVLDKGEIVEFDTPEILLTHPNSIFCGMAKEAGISGQATAAANTPVSTEKAVQLDNNDTSVERLYSDVVKEQNVNN